MTAQLPARQPFAVLDSPRLHALSSIKNRQNALSATTFSSDKQTFPTASKKRNAPAIFDEDLDAENVNPQILSSPTKRSKVYDGTPKKVSQFVLTSLKQATTSNSCPATISAPVATKRKALDISQTASTTPIGQSRGSPKHKRIGILSKRRASGSPFRRIDPPSFSKNSSPGLPFSLDEALSGTIPSYNPRTKPVPAETAVPTLEEAMPKSWFFDIHVDTAEEEAANLMEHSAHVLDISSDDDVETKRRNEERERGKENIPPPDFLASVNISSAMETQEEAAIPQVKVPKYRRFYGPDAMVEDRSPLGDLPPSDYYGPGLDASSFAIVDTQPDKPSSLSKEIKDFDFEVSVPAPAEETTAVVDQSAEKEFPLYEEPVAAPILEQISEVQVQA